jgi:hypothetical protein
MQAVQESCKKELSPPLCCPGDKPHFQKWILKSEFVFEIEYFKELNKKDYFKIKGFVLVKNPWSKFYIFKQNLLHSHEHFDGSPGEGKEENARHSLNEGTARASCPSRLRVQSDNGVCEA